MQVFENACLLDIKSVAGFLLQSGTVGELKRMQAMQNLCIQEIDLIVYVNFVNHFH